MSTKLFFVILLYLCFVIVLAEFYNDYFLPQPAVGPVIDGTLSQDDELKSEERKPTGYNCALCVQIDHEFIEVYNTNGIVQLKNALYHMVDQISWIFRSTDWNNDGKPDNIGVKIVTMTLGWIPYKHELPEHYDTPKLALDYLKIFARMNFSSCCLGVGFTNRQFLNGLDGISFAASRKAHGGICDHRNPLEGFMRSMNIILISARGLDGSQLSMYHITKALTHELGHAFGANLHDNEHKAHGCWGFQPGEYTEKQPASTPKLGRYIMWPKSSGDPNSKPLSNNLRFSTCSKNEIALVISERRQLKNCFIPDYNPFCGNGVVEGLEECDCGSVLDCAKQKCCGVRLSKKPCMIMDAKACPLNPIARPYYGRNEILNNSVSRILTSNYSVLLIIPFIVTIIWSDCHQ